MPHELDRPVTLTLPPDLAAVLARIEWRLCLLADDQAEIKRSLTRLVRAVFQTATTEEIIMTVLDDLEAKASAQDTVIDGVATTLTTLRDELRDALAAGDTARIQAVVDHLDANTAELAEAIADVPPTPSPTPGPTPEPGPAPTPEPTPGP